MRGATSSPHSLWCCCRCAAVVVMLLFVVRCCCCCGAAAVAVLLQVCLPAMTRPRSGLRQQGSRRAAARLCWVALQSQVRHAFVAGLAAGCLLVWWVGAQDQRVSAGRAAVLRGVPGVTQSNCYGGEGCAPGHPPAQPASLPTPCTLRATYTHQGRKACGLRHALSGHSAACCFQSALLRLHGVQRWRQCPAAAAPDWAITTSCVTAVLASFPSCVADVLAVGVSGLSVACPALPRLLRKRLQSTIRLCEDPPAEDDPQPRRLHALQGPSGLRDADTQERGTPQVLHRLPNVPCPVSAWVHLCRASCCLLGLGFALWGLGLVLWGLSVALWALGRGNQSGQCREEE